MLFGGVGAERRIASAPGCAMSLRASVIVSACLLSACARLPIEDGRKVGPLVQVKDSFTSCFLLEYAPKRAALFDACWNDEGQAVQKALEANGLTPDAVDAVFLSHGHTDHLGGLGMLPQASVYALEAERDLIREGGNAVNVPLQDGDEVVLGDYTIHVYAVTGHTRGSAVYEVDGVLLMGDTVIAQKDGSLAPPAERYSDDPAENDASVRALMERLDEAGVAVDWVAPSHSGPVRGTKALRAY